MIKQIIKWIKEGFVDPVRGCELYKNEGCSHVDGLLCDYPKCEMLKEYRKNGNTNKESCLKGRSNGKRVNSTNLQTSNPALRRNTQHGK